MEILWNKANAYFRGYLCAHENSENFYTTIIPTLTVNNLLKYPILGHFTKAMA